jgi:hypothetical protein
MSNLEKLYEEMVVPQKKETTMEFKRVPKNLEEDSKLTPRKTELDEKSKEKINMEKWIKDQNSKNESIKSPIKKSTLKESEAHFFDDFERDAGMRHDVLEYMLNFFSPEDLLTELVSALGDDTALENFGYIARMNDIPKKSEYESGE